MEVTGTSQCLVSHILQNNLFDRRKKLIQLKNNLRVSKLLNFFFWVNYSFNINKIIRKEENNLLLLTKVSVSHVTRWPSLKRLLGMQVQLETSNSPSVHLAYD